MSLATRLVDLYWKVVDKKYNDRTLTVPVVPLSYTLEDAMLIDQPLTLRFDKSERISFIQGEDRTFEVGIFTAVMVQPVDVSLRKSVAIHFPRLTGGTIKRRMAAVSFPLNVMQQGEGSLVTAPGHGFVTGDKVTVTGPQPFDEAKTYVVVADTSDVMRFYDDQQSPVIIPNGETASLCVLLQGAVTLKPGLGVSNTVLLNLPAYVTSGIGYGQAQDVQAVIIDDEGLVRIVLGTKALDVFPQPLP